MSTGYKIEDPTALGNTKV